MRNRYKKAKYYASVSEAIGRNYKKLRALCYKGSRGFYGSRSYEDIFQDTVLYVIQDVGALGKTDSELIEYFMYRYRMIEYQTIKDSQQINTTPYADYIQTQKGTEENR
ncbi:hypothetical protein GPL06_03960 [Bacteroides salyersiae]|uniref:hypothetical protein n=1 Tax=Bacteroides salyersiae TaxID=291644 RepID=UPI001C010084|nr:hypothetical protein [Bacteroides salyersiae]MBT9871983.1 hypothetical protein [Bacteroides salyersiae]